MTLGSEDIHFQVAPFFATLIGYHHHGVAVGVLFVQIKLVHVLTLGKRSQLTISVHPSVVIVHESPLVKCRPVNKSKQL